MLHGLRGAPQGEACPRQIRNGWTRVFSAASEYFLSLEQLWQREKPRSHPVVPAFPARVCWLPEPALSCDQRGLRGRDQSPGPMIHPWRGGQVCSCTRCTESREVPEMPHLW